MVFLDDTGMSNVVPGFTNRVISETRHLQQFGANTEHLPQQRVVGVSMSHARNETLGNLERKIFTGKF